MALAAHRLKLHRLLRLYLENGVLWCAQPEVVSVNVKAFNTIKPACFSYKRQYEHAFEDWALIPYSRWMYNL